MNKILRTLLIFSILLIFYINPAFCTSSDDDYSDSYDDSYSDSYNDNSYESNSYNNSSTNANSNSNSSSSSSNSNLDANTLSSNTGSSTKVTSVSPLSNLPEANLGLNNVLNIILILFAIAILIRLKYV